MVVIESISLIQAVIADLSISKKTAFLWWE